jgi:hypothetical protein
LLVPEDETATNNPSALDQQTDVQNPATDVLVVQLVPLDEVTTWFIPVPEAATAQNIPNSGAQATALQKFISFMILGRVVQATPSKDVITAFAGSRVAE